MIDRKSAKEVKFENDDIKDEILEGLSAADMEKFLAKEILGIGRNRAIERCGDDADLDATVEEEALR